MPIYEFRCKDCDNLFEELIVRTGDRDDIACPRCGSKEVSRLISRTCSFTDKTVSSATACGPKSGSGFS